MLRLKSQWHTVRPTLCCPALVWPDVAKTTLPRESRKATQDD